MAKSATDLAIDYIDAKIKDLERAKEVIIQAATTPYPDAPADKPKRTRGKGKRGLPTTANVDGV